MPGSKYWSLTTPAALQETARLTGASRFGLLGAARFNPESHTGEKVEARGLLYRDSGQNLLNPTSLESTGTNCGN